MMEMFALRHVATQRFMPQTENNRGYSHWDPTVKGGTKAKDEYGDYELPNENLGAAYPDSVRLFTTRKAAENARVAWARGVAAVEHRGDPMDGFTQVGFKDAGRKKTDLEVVKMWVSPLSKIYETISKYVDKSIALQGLKSSFGAPYGKEDVERSALYAENYRWLREQHWDTSALCVVVDPKKAVRLGHECPSGDRLDEAIAAARGMPSTPKSLHTLTDREKLMGELADAWKRRREGRGYKPGTATHAKAQLEFFMGVHALLEALGLPGLEGELLMLSVGRNFGDRSKA
jgi:hypothetical protein